MSDPNDPRDCPFCGGSQIHTEAFDGTAIVSCQTCLAVGPVTSEQSVSQAWKRWNERPRECKKARCSSEPPHGLLDCELEDFELNDFV
jgi:Lar family restriction alleviation protein